MYIICAPLLQKKMGGREECLGEGSHVGNNNVITRVILLEQLWELGRRTAKSEMTHGVKLFSFLVWSHGCVKIIMNCSLV